MKLHHSAIAATTLSAALALCPQPSQAQELAAAAQPPAAGRSAHFDAVSAHLDLGGVVFGYVDVDGDAERLSGFVQDLLDQLRPMANEGNVPAPLVMLDAKALVSDLGLTGIRAMGLSSYKYGELHRNKYYLHAPGGRTGLLKLAGGKAAPFAAASLAPAGSDLVIEQDIDLKSGFELLQGLVRKIGGPDAALEFSRGTSRPVGEIDLTVAGIFAHLDTKVTLVGRLHPDRLLPLPEKVPFKVPGFDLLISLDRVGPVFEKLVESIPAEQRQQMLSMGDGYQQLAIPVPPEIAEIITPVVRHFTDSGRVILASSPAFLDEAVGGETSLWDDAAFKTAITGLPEEGNGISYLSPRFGEQYLKFYKHMLGTMQKEGAIPLGAAEMMVGLVQQLGLSAEFGQARVVANLADGILIAENTVASAKQNVVSMGAGVAAMMVGWMVPFHMASAREEKMLFEELEARGAASDHSHSGEDVPPRPRFDTPVPKSAPPEPEAP